MARADQTEIVKAQPGSQTLARGLRALIAVTESGTGLTTQEVAERLSIHRSIAYRLLQTFVDFRFLTRADNGVYRPGARLVSLSDAYLPGLRELALPSMRRLAERLGSTIALFVAEGEEAVAVSLVEPTNTTHHLSFRAGMRTPLDRGSAGYALASALPPQPGEPAGVKLARELGFAVSSGEIEAGAHGVAALIPTRPSSPLMCLHLVTFRSEVAAGAGPVMVQAAGEIGQLFDGGDRLSGARVPGLGQAG
ncbi:MULTISPECIES: IclR family transcriptional regulator [unclassified Parafrankia]|uniref:IclR family transcriptional regulator n=1 Tax=unclassified Parafrankia TaxID=2994368 RepID=UPI000DA5377A|nr:MULTISPECIES: helix-turn-helix domain-containing protein [unclassified Parafrankia]TCJ35743.1 IclR family transcriptional regulator [Parafrankia sp. BMG5.11]CAI7976786.1 Transcriptional regulator, IclR family [Frankia sp. Hr75.2]SQD95304.1 Transcriptional regulator, IclR family [Parafrankia sp. Ea1.12]